MAEFFIRKSRIEDAEEICRAKIDGFAEEVRLYGHNPLKNNTAEKEAAFIKNSEGINFSYVIINKNNEEIVGGCGGIIEGEGKYYLGCI